MLQSETTYENGNLTASVTTGSRQTTTYSNDTNRSLVTGVTDANGNTTTTAYDSLNRPTTVTSGSASVSYTYSADRLTGIQHGSTNYAITYAPGGQQATVSVGSRTLVSNTYDPATQLLTKQTYGNNQSWNYIYDNTDTLICKYSSEGTAYYYFYDNEGKLARVETWAVSVSGSSVTKTTLLNTACYSYDSSERLVAIREENHAVSRSFDSKENVTGFTESFGAVDFAYTYSYDNDNRPTGTSFGNTGTSTAYDSFSRMSGTAVTYNNSSLISASYTYRQTDSTGTIEYNDSEDTSPETGTTVYETTQVRDYAVTAGNTTTTYRFEYDPNGNITSISDGTYTTSYEYDTLGQLTKESNRAAAKAWQYSYDNCGNILSKTEYDYTNNDGTWTQAATGTTINYSYNDSTWGDLLTAYDGQSITYDAIGNPLSYRGMSFTWQGGRQLAAVTKDGTTTSYTYNENGLRTAKTTGTETTNYYYSGDVLTGLETTGYSLYFHYDENGGIIGYTKHTAATDTEYFYVKNLQGDILQVLDAAGTAVAQYSYDAWGNILTAEGTEAAINPIRYRGYYFDTETGLYYLQSRYYDAEVSRFINADAFTSTTSNVLGNNMFAYCENNPACFADNGGCSPIWILNLADYAVIHKMVQQLCCSSYGWEQEVFVSGPLGKGRLDLYNNSTREYYEVKSVGVANSVETIAQMSKYDYATVKETKGNKRKGLTTFGERIFRGKTKVSGYFQYGVYDITYQSDGYGLIVYDCKLNRGRAAECAIILISTASFFIFPESTVLIPAMG